MYWYKIQKFLQRSLRAKRFDEFSRTSKVVPKTVFTNLSPSAAHKVLEARSTPELSFDAQLNLQGWRDEGRAKLAALLAIDLLKADRSSQKPYKAWVAKDSDGVYEKYYLPGELSSWIPIILCRPHRRRSPNWLICSQGHNSGMHNSIGVSPVCENEAFLPAGDREFAYWCLQNGVAAACIEHRCFGEREENSLFSKAQHGCQDAAMHALALGTTLIGERLLDLKAVIDFVKIKDQSCNSIGLLGNSSGGTVSLLGAALIDDVEFCIASSCFSSFTDYLLNRYHCVEMYIPGIRKYFEMSDLAGLIAPKKLLLIQGVNDYQFPLRGVRSEFKKLKNIYRHIGCEDNVSLQIGHAGHRFYSSLATSGAKRLAIF